MQHELDLLQFHLTVDQAIETTPGVSWVFWKSRDELSSTASWEFVTSPRGARGRVKLIPDACFAIQTPRGRSLFFVEIDRGTEAAATVFRRKLLAYQQAFERGVVRTVLGYRTFRVLTVASEPRRLELLLRIASSLKHPLLFWFATLGALRSDTALIGSVWRHGQSPTKTCALHDAGASAPETPDVIVEEVVGAA